MPPFPLPPPTLFLSLFFSSTSARLTKRISNALSYQKKLLGRACVPCSQQLLLAVSCFFLLLLAGSSCSSCSCASTFLLLAPAPLTGVRADTLFMACNYSAREKQAAIAVARIICLERLPSARQLVSDSCHCPPTSPPPPLLLCHLPHNSSIASFRQ